MSKKVRNVWDEFKNGKIVVECRKPHELNEFAKELKKRGFRWLTSTTMSPQILKLMYANLPIYIYIGSGDGRLLYSTSIALLVADQVDILGYDDFMAKDYKFINSVANKKIVITFNVNGDSFGAIAEIYNKNCVCTNRVGSRGCEKDPFDYALTAIKVFEKRRDEALENKDQWKTDSLGQILPDRIAKKLDQMPRGDLKDKDRTNSLVEGLKHAAKYECVYGMCTRWSDGDLHGLFCDTDAAHFYDPLGNFVKKHKPSKWDEFKAGKFAVEVDATNILLFLKECEEQGLMWVSGDRALKYIPEFVAKAGGNGYMIYNNILKRLQCLRYYAYSGMALTYDEFVKRS